MEFSSPKNKNSYIFSKNIFSYISGENFESLKILIFLFIFSVYLERTFQTHSQRKKLLILFLIKKQNFFKLKYFLIMIIKRFCFFSFYNIFFNTQPDYFLHLLRDFCKVNNHIVAFFLFLL